MYVVCMLHFVCYSTCYLSATFWHRLLCLSRAHLITNWHNYFGRDICTVRFACLRRRSVSLLLLLLIFVRVIQLLMQSLDFK